MEKSRRSGVPARPSHRYRETINKLFRKSRRFSPCDWGWFIVQLHRVPELLDDAVAVRTYLRSKGIIPSAQRRAR